MRGLVVLGALLFYASPAGASPALRAGTPAGAPFATALAQMPASVVGRRARQIAIYGASTSGNQGSGFNPISGAGGNLGLEESTRGAFLLNGAGVWVKDLVTDARADSQGVSYTISPKAFWYWGGRKLPVTYRDFVYTLRELDDPANVPHPGSPYGNLDPTRFTHTGLRQVTFFWRTSGCSDDFPCGPSAIWQHLFSVGLAGSPGLFPSFALKGLDFTKIWTSCICGYDGKPVSDGPFYLASYTPGQGETMKRNPYYWKPARLSEVGFNFFADPTQLVEAMRLGVVDAMGTPQGNPALASPLEGVRGIAINRSRRSPIFEHLEFREGAAPAGPGVTKGSSNVLLRAPWMRQAISLALNRGALITAGYGSSTEYVRPDDNVFFSPGQSGYRADFARWRDDPGKALTLLKAHCTAGTGPATPDPANTKIWQCAGLPATFPWTWTANNSVRTAVEQAAKTELRSVGIAITERPLPPNVIFTRRGFSPATTTSPSSRSS
jgi:ABC-type transport system substrate-binding protein